MSKTIIFLGAGASAADGAPVQSSLFREYFQVLRDRKQTVDPHHVRYFKHFWGIDVQHDDFKTTIFPTFEEALGMLELAKARQESFHGYHNTANSNKIDHTIEDLIFLIVDVLKEKLQKKNIYHSKLINNIINKGLTKDVAFISLNYDILIDNAISEQYYSIDLDYGIDFVNYTTTKDWQPPSIDKSIQLYKIHGSLNWLYCPVCKQILITPNEKGVSLLIDRTQKYANACPACNGSFVPILIPPTFFKVMSNSQLVRIWDLSERALTSADTIIFCGYSLPDADMHIKYLLKRGCLNRSKSLPKIVVNNNHPGKTTSMKDDEKYRYQRLFASKVEYTDFSFSDFSDNLYGIV